MKVLSVFGISKSGKTTTIEKIIAELRERGYSVGSVKNIHYEKFAIDTKGSNTDRHRRAGAQLVTARGLHETDILYGEQLPIEKILGLYDHDFVILEGVERFNVPKIITAHTLPEIDERINPSVFAIAGVISDEHDEYNGVPVFNALKDHKALVDYIEEKVFDLLPNVGPEVCRLCGLGCEELLRQILDGRKVRKDCLLDRTQVCLVIGDKKIKMTLFDFFKEPVRDMMERIGGYVIGPD